MQIWDYSWSIWQLIHKHKQGKGHLPWRHFYSMAHHCCHNWIPQWIDSLRKNWILPTFFFLSTCQRFSKICWKHEGELCCSQLHVWTTQLTLHCNSSPIIIQILHYIITTPIPHYLPKVVAFLEFSYIAESQNKECTCKQLDFLTVGDRAPRSLLSSLCHVKLMTD